LTDALRSAGGAELMRRLLHTMLQALTDAEATPHIDAGPHERTETRTTQRNGTCDKLVATTTGDLTVKIPKLRTGSFFPSLLAPRRHIDVALHAVVMQAWVEGCPRGRLTTVESGPYLAIRSSLRQPAGCPTICSASS